MSERTHYIDREWRNPRGDKRPSMKEELTNLYQSDGRLDLTKIKKLIAERVPDKKIIEAFAQVDLLEKRYQILDAEKNEPKTPADVAEAKAENAEQAEHLLETIERYAEADKYEEFESEHESGKEFNELQNNWGEGRPGKYSTKAKNPKRLIKGEPRYKPWKKAA